MPSRWWRLLRRHALTGVRVVVYTRANCPLCDDAIAFLERERRKLGFQMQLIDVDSSDALRAQHGEWVPVVEVEGKVRFRGHINAVLWRRLVTALSQNGLQN